MLSVTEYSFQEVYLEEGAIKDFFSKHWDKAKKRLDTMFAKSTKRMKEIEVTLKKHGFDVEKIKKAAKSEAKVENGKIANFQGKINNFVRDLYAKKFDGDDFLEGVRKVVLSAVLLAIVLFINTIVNYAIISMGVNPKIAFALTSIFCAPITEETAKMISVEQKATGTYFVIFNVAEFLLYLIQAAAFGMSAGQMFFSRIIPVLVHWLFTMIHVDYQKKGEPEKGLGIAIICHMLWNTFASLRIIG